MSEVIGVEKQDYSQMYGTQYERNSAEELKTQFMTLLVAQLKNQDPMNPIDNQDFVSQLATFSSLEQLITIGSGVENLNGGLNYLNNGVDYLATLLTYVTMPDMEDGNEASQGDPAEGEPGTPVA